jgi:tRNA (mo5U34)-methyltransferase
VKGGSGSPLLYLGYFFVKCVVVGIGVSRDIHNFLDAALKFHALIDIKTYCEKVFAARESVLDTEFWKPLQNRLENLPRPDSANVTFSGDSTVSISVANYSHSALEQAHSIVHELKPWRKGPFSFLGLEIDAEWQSDRKWDRIRAALGPLSGRSILDVGCNNGYYMFRCLAEDPAFVLGVDPGARFLYQFKLINHFVQASQLRVEPLGVEDIGVFSECFDVVLCMGVLYHRKQQYETLELLYRALRSRGRLLLETLIVGDDTPYCLCPPSRYAMMRNVWFVPSKSVLLEWLSQVGFTEIEVVADSWVTPEEQRQTEFAPFKSLESFLDEKTSSLTVEGFPAPRRLAVLAYRR